MLRKINRFLWKHYGFCIRIEYKIKSHTPKNPSEVYAYNPFGYGQRAIYKDGKFHSIEDGTIIENVSRFTYLN